jgi:uncharacterized membrane protein
MDYIVLGLFILFVFFIFKGYHQSKLEEREKESSEEQKNRESSET